MLLKKLDEIAEWIGNWIVVISGVAVCGLIFAGAVMRYILHTDFYGSEELILLAAFWLYFIGSALAAKHGTQIKAEMLDMFVKNKVVHGIAAIVRDIICLAMAVLASVWSTQYVIWNYNINMRSNVFRFPVYITIIPIAISFIMWSIYCVRNLVYSIKEFVARHSEEGN